MASLAGGFLAGKPLANLSIEERIRLMSEVCRALLINPEGVLVMDIPVADTDIAAYIGDANTTHLDELYKAVQTRIHDTVKRNINGSDNLVRDCHCRVAQFVIAASYAFSDAHNVAWGRHDPTLSQIINFFREHYEANADAVNRGLPLVRDGNLATPEQRLIGWAIGVKSILEVDPTIGGHHPPTAHLDDQYAATSTVPCGFNVESIARAVTVLRYLLSRCAIKAKRPKLRAPSPVTAITRYISPLDRKIFE